MTSPLRILIVDDSSVCRDAMRELLEAEGDLRVVAEAGDGPAGLALAARHRPDLVAVDLRMPGMDGLELIERLMAETPVPILVVTGDPTGATREGVFDAVRRGALDVARKPDLDDARAADALRRRVRQLAHVPVVRHLSPRVRSTVPPPAMGPVDPSRRRATVVGIAASAGGPAALVTVLRSLPRNFPVCIGLVQHLPAGFTRSFAEFLTDRTPLRARVIEGPTTGRPGEVLLTDVDAHLVLRADGHFDAWRAEPVDGYRPSATVLFHSMAAVLGHRAMGVVLTGMGRDGVDGLLELRHRGAMTVAQDQETTAVYGMPRAAAEEGAAVRVLPLGAVGPAIAGAVGFDLLREAR